MSCEAPGMASTHMDAELYSFGCMDTQLDTHDIHTETFKYEKKQT